MLSSLHAQQGSRSVPVPTKSQLVWQGMEYYLFVHFGPNTFTDKEWGAGNEPEDAFNPGNLNCDQWCKTAKAAGAAGIIITAKHHDGFCLEYIFLPGIGITRNMAHQHIMRYMQV